MTELEKEVQALKERVKYLEGVIEGMSRGMISNPQPLPWYGPITRPHTGIPNIVPFTVTCGGGNV